MNNQKTIKHVVRKKRPFLSRIAMLLSVCIVAPFSPRISEPDLLGSITLLMVILVLTILITWLVRRILDNKSPASKWHYLSY